MTCHTCGKPLDPEREHVFKNVDTDETRCLVCEIERTGQEHGMDPKIVTLYVRATRGL